MDGDAGGDEQPERRRNVLEGHGLVADVEDHAEVPANKALHLRDGQPR